MKKLSIFLLALLALFSLSACKDTEDDKTAGSEVVTEGEQTTGGEEVSEPESEPAPIEYKEMYLVGGSMGWEPVEENLIEPSSFAELAKLDYTINSTMTEEDVYAVYKISGVKVTSGAGWETEAYVNGRKRVYDGGYTIKALQATYDKDLDLMIKGQWMPDPHTCHVTSLTPDKLFVPEWVEADQGAGNWSQNPVITSGAGIYTIYVVDFGTVSAADTPSFGFAVYRDIAIVEEEMLQEQIYQEANSANAGATEFTFSAQIAAINTTAGDDGYDVDLIVDFKYVVIGVTNAVEATGLPQDITGLQPGTKVTITGKIDPTAEALVIGEGDEAVSAEIVFSDAVITWTKVGAKAGVYVRGGFDVNWGALPAYEMTINKDGNPEITVELTEGIEFKVADADWGAVNHGFGSLDEKSAELFEDVGGNIKVLTTGKYKIALVEGKIVAELVK